MQSPRKERLARENNRSSMSKKLQLWIGIFVSLACIVAVLLVVDLEQVSQSLTTTDWRFPIAVFATAQLSFMVLRALRWRQMLLSPRDKDGVDSNKVRYWTLFHAQNVGYLITNLLPFRLGDLARSYIVGLEPSMSGMQALSSVVLERTLDGLMIVLFFGAAVLLAPSLPVGMAAFATVFSVAVLAGFLVMLLAAGNRNRALEFARHALTKIGRKDTETWIGRAALFLDGFQTLTLWRSFFPVVGLSILLWFFIVIAFFLGIRAVWPGVTWAAALLAVCAAAFGISAPSSPGSVGVFHGAVVVGLSVFPLSTESALSFAVIYHATMYLVNLALGLVGLWKSGQSLSAVVSTARNINKR